MYGTMELPARFERGELCCLRSDSIHARDDRGRDLYDPARGRIGPGGGQPGCVPELILRHGWLAVHRQI